MTYKVSEKNVQLTFILLVNLFWNYFILFFYMTSVYPNKWPFRMHFNIFNDWIRRSVYIWPNYSIQWLLENSLIIIPSFVLLSKLSVMNELWFQGLKHSTQCWKEFIKWSFYCTDDIRLIYTIFPKIFIYMIQLYQ